MNRTATISGVTTRAADGDGPHDVAASTITIGDRTHDVWMRVTGAPLSASAEPFFAVALQPAMSVGADIVCEEPLSGRLLDAQAALQPIFGSFTRGRQQVVAVGAERAATRPRAPGVGLCFSLGVDGMYSLVSHLHEVTHLVLIHDLDYRRDAPFRAQIVEAARSVAEKTGKTLVEIDGTYHEMIRQYDLSDAHTPGQSALGAMLVAAGYLLRDSIGTLLVPSSATARTLAPFGSHPLTDPLWSTEDLEVVHDAIAVERVDKIAGFADFEPAFTI